MPARARDAPLARDHLAHREAVLGVVDRRRQHLAERSASRSARGSSHQASTAPGTVTVKHALQRHLARAAPRVLGEGRRAPARGRCRSGRPALLARAPRQHQAVAADAGVVGLDDALHRDRGDRRVEGIAAGAQRRERRPSDASGWLVQTMPCRASAIERALACAPPRVRWLENMPPPTASRPRVTTGSAQARESRKVAGRLPARSECRRRVDSTKLCFVEAELCFVEAELSGGVATDPTPGTDPLAVRADRSEQWWP